MDFRNQFEAFFGENDIAVRGSAPKPEQAGSMIFKYSEEEEYFENLQLSGSFKNCQWKRNKEHKKVQTQKNE